MIIRKTISMLAGVTTLVICVTDQLSHAQDRSSRAMEKHDRNGDGKISRDEWRKPFRIFREIDGDGNGFISLQELRTRFGEIKNPSLENKLAKTIEGQVTLSEIDDFTLCAMGRGFRCTMKPAIRRGLFETGLRPSFPKYADCLNIDEQWAIPYTWKRKREAYHGGIDIPAPWDTPIIAVADGMVIGKFSGKTNPRGIEIVLRHSPSDTGLPVWIFTQYTHFSAMPKQKLGQRVQLGEILGPTGNTGISVKTGQQSDRRRPAIHFGVFFNRTGKYAALRRKIIPVNGHWMDPNALFRKTGPFDSTSLKSLPENLKKTPISVLFNNGKTLPSNAKVVWPYRCQRRSGIETKFKSEGETQFQYDD